MICTRAEYQKKSVSEELERSQKENELVKEQLKVLQEQHNLCASTDTVQQ